MKHHLFYFVFSIIAAISFVSCIPNLNRPEDYIDSDNFFLVFESFWTGMNNNYLFWDIDTTNWDAAYTKYRPLFSQLNSNNTIDMDSAHSYFKEMTAGLVDGHFCMTFDEKLNLPSIQPSWGKKGRDENYNDYFQHNRDVRLRNLLPLFLEEWKSDGITINGNIVNIRYPQTTVGFINKNILYVSMDEFKLDKMKDNNSPMKFFFDKLKETNIEGIIIDVRGNRGGEVRALNFFVGHFITDSLLYGYTRTKLGEGRLDYSPWLPFYTNLVLSDTPILAPIVVLADEYSASGAELLTMAVASLSNGYVVGKSTWGAQGAFGADDNIIFNGGQFGNYFYHATTSFVMFAYIDKKIYEGIGFPPDIDVNFDSEAAEEGKDTQLEAAIDLINNPSLQAAIKAAKR